MHTSAITRKSSRKANDAYYTPTKATEKLIERIEIKGLVLEPCEGTGNISKVLRNNGLKVRGRDITVSPNYDATYQDFWDQEIDLGLDWVITNPPFNQAATIIPLAYESVNLGCAFLLRLSYLEPCRNRSTWLAEHPPNKLIVLPRISFTGDNKTDSCTTAWMVWRKGCNFQEIIIVP